MTDEEKEEVFWARVDLSIAVAESRYLGKWHRGDVEGYRQAKAFNRETQQRARAVLHKYSDTIWYYKNLPTAGNKFRGTSKKNGTLS